MPGGAHDHPGPDGSDCTPGGGLPLLRLVQGHHRRQSADAAPHRGPETAHLFVGFPAALLFGRIGDRLGARQGILLAIVVYILVVFWAWRMTATWEFYAMAVVIGLVQGGIQALSRSYYSRLIPKNQAAEYYGFYNMLGKFAVIIGPALMGIVGLMVKRMMMPPSPSAEQITAVGQLAARWGIGSILILFVLGAVLFYFVDEDKGREQAEYLSNE